MGTVIREKGNILVKKPTGDRGGEKGSHRTNVKEGGLDLTLSRPWKRLSSLFFGSGDRGDPVGGGKKRGG